MSFGVVREDFLAAEVALPEQFQQIWHQSTTVMPARALALGVLRQAMDDLRRFRDARRPSWRPLYTDAHQWVMSDDGRWPYSFLNLCDVLQLSPESVRAGLLGDASSISSTPIRAPKPRPLRANSPGGLPGTRHLKRRRTRKRLSGIHRA
jgi:hypothetical protein